MMYIVKDMNTDKELYSSPDSNDIAQFVEDLELGTYYVTDVHTCKGCDSTETEKRYDFHGIYTGYYCHNCYENNYPYRKDDYANGTGVADDGTPLEND